MPAYKTLSVAGQSAIRLHKCLDAHQTPTGELPQIPYIWYTTVPDPSGLRLRTYTSESNKKPYDPGWSARPN